MTILTIPYTGEVTYNSFYLQNTLLITVNNLIDNKEYNDAINILISLIKCLSTNQQDNKEKIMLVIGKLVDCYYIIGKFYKVEEIIEKIIFDNSFPDIEILKYSYTLASVSYINNNYEVAYEYYNNLINNIHLIDNLDDIIIVKMRLKYCFLFLLVK